MKNERIKALSEFLEIKEEEIEATYDEETFEAEGNEYLVLTDEEADQRASDYIKETVWAFNSWFLADHMPAGISDEVIKILQEKCEGANEGLKAMIEDIDEFVVDAISADGRGHFMSSYDGEEHEHGNYFIYRTN